MKASGRKGRRSLITSAAPSPFRPECRTRYRPVSFPGVEGRDVHRVELQPRRHWSPAQKTNADLRSFDRGEQFCCTCPSHPMLRPGGHVLPGAWCSGPCHHHHGVSVPDLEHTRFEGADHLEGSPGRFASDRGPRPSHPVDRAYQQPRLRAPTGDGLRLIEMVRHPHPRETRFEIHQRGHNGPVLVGSVGLCGKQYLSHTTDGRNRVGVSPSTDRSHSLHPLLTPHDGGPVCSQCLHFVLTPPALPAHTTNTTTSPCRTLT